MEKLIHRITGLGAAWTFGLCALTLICAGANAQELQSLDCSQESSLKSTKFDTPTSVDFVNHSGETVLVYWLDYSGKRVLYRTLPAEQNYVQQTYVTHPWVVVSQATNKCVAIFEPLAGQHIALLCGVPDSETSEKDGWERSTVADFKQTLGPATADFTGRKIWEEDPGGGKDSCWFRGSKYDPLDEVTNGPNDFWTVSRRLIWGDDAIGFYPEVVRYYRRKGQTPCGTVTPQRMVMSCGTTKRAYFSDTLKINLTNTEVSSERAGVTAKKTWP